MYVFSIKPTIIYIIDTLQSIFLIKLNQMKSTQEEESGASLNPYSGKWGKGEALHLLRRATIGPNAESMNTVISKGLCSSASKLKRDELLKLLMDNKV